MSPNRQLNPWLRWYPKTWRDHYGEELVLFMQDSYGSGRPPARARMSLLVGGLRERARQSGLTGDSAPPSDRVRAGALLVLVGWAGFVLAGSSFAKFSEHFDNALPGGIDSHLPPASHAVADLAYGLVQVLAAVSGFAVLLGTAVALPAFVRFLRSGGWPAVRGHVMRALTVTAVTVGATVPLLLWAHHLNSQLRNVGSGSYGAVFIAWAALMALNLGLWTLVAVIAARQVNFSRSVLLAEAALAVIVTATMAVILAATSTWWAAIAADAPSFLNSNPGGAPVNPLLGATAAVMLAASAAGAIGVLRITRNLSSLRVR